MNAETVAWVEAWIALVLGCVFLVNLTYRLTVGEWLRRRRGEP